jgi:putative cardiolipin synthase
MISQVALIGVIIFVTACSTLPKNPEKIVSYGCSPAGKGTLVESSEAVLSKAKSGESGFMLIRKNSDALNWRLALIDHAEKSIDLQVFIWSDDTSGRLVLDRLIIASKRGVNIRLLIDDMSAGWTDEIIALIDRMNNIQLRRFNPGLVRDGIVRRSFQMSTQFRQLNRRMHNKQMIVDGTWGIIGGRNLGDPYFGLSSKYNNSDLDLLITGALINDLTVDFDEYWNADASYPGNAMAAEFSDKKIEKLLEEHDEEVEEDLVLLDKTTIVAAPCDWSPQFATLKKKMVIGVGLSLKDSPAVKGDRGIRLVEQIALESFDVEHTTSAVTPYMIPSKNMLSGIKKSIEGGQEVRLLVPSMESNNRPMVHSHYKKYRKKLLLSGVKLYELQGNPSDEFRAFCDTPPVKSKFISLHTKGFVLDERWVLLGSLNLDPRSININTEHMVIIDCPALAEAFLKDFDLMIAPSNSYLVTLNDKDNLRWNSDDKEFRVQPAGGFIQRCKDFFWRWVPLENQL